MHRSLKNVLCLALTLRNVWKAPHDRLKICVLLYFLEEKTAQKALFFSKRTRLVDQQFRLHEYNLTIIFV